MLRQLLVGGAASAFNIAIHALVMMIVVRVAQAKGAKSNSHSSLLLIAVMIPTVSVLMVTHAIEVMVWSFVYLMFDAVPADAYTLPSSTTRRSAMVTSFRWNAGAC
jgi:hypothetical protein